MGTAAWGATASLWEPPFHLLLGRQAAARRDQGTGRSGSPGNPSFAPLGIELL